MNIKEVLQKADEVIEDQKLREMFKKVFYVYIGNKCKSRWGENLYYYW